MRPLIAALFICAVAATVLAGDGLVLVPHTHAPGTPPEHPHGLALYRFPIALLGEPVDAPRARPADDGVASFRLTAPASETFAGMSLLLLVAVVVSFARPRIQATRPAAFLSRSAPQWAAVTPTGPPRLSIV